MNTTHLFHRYEEIGVPAEGELVTKGRVQVWAPPRVWGPKVPVWTRFGVAGPNTNKTVYKTLEFETQSEAPSLFEIQVYGGDRMIHATGPGAVRIPLTGNTATQLTVRLKSATFGQNVFVSS